MNKLGILVGGVALAGAAVFRVAGHRAGTGNAGPFDGTARYQWH